MNTFTLGGIHPPEHKELACNSAIEVAKPPQTAYIPLSQHIGMPSREMVEVGQRVLAGQQIGNPAGFVSAPVHATISGKVTAIELFTNPMGKRIPAIVIESDKADEWVSFEEDPNYMERPSDVLKERVKNAGIVGMGGATFPTIVKLSPPKEKHVDAVIINGAECEPYLTADHRLMLEHPQ
ncbi:MAG: hypothetical protein HQK97_13060, partial [Nitrospirae bacterium]|nr:hypothetical protein [Nitrospirota bacterium]